MSFRSVKLIVSEADSLKVAKGRLRALRHPDFVIYVSTNTTTLCAKAQMQSHWRGIATESGTYDPTTWHGSRFATARFDQGFILPLTPGESSLLITVRAGNQVVGQHPFDLGKATDDRRCFLGTLPLKDEKGEISGSLKVKIEMSYDAVESPEVKEFLPGKPKGPVIVEDDVDEGVPDARKTSAEVKTRPAMHQAPPHHPKFTHTPATQDYARHPSDDVEGWRAWSDRWASQSIDSITSPKPPTYGGAPYAASSPHQVIMRHHHHYYNQQDTVESNDAEEDEEEEEDEEGAQTYTYLQGATPVQPTAVGGVHYPQFVPLQYQTVQFAQPTQYVQTQPAVQYVAAAPLQTGQVQLQQATVQCPQVYAQSGQTQQVYTAVQPGGQMQMYGAAQPQVYGAPKPQMYSAPQGAGEATEYTTVGFIPTSTTVTTTMAAPQGPVRFTFQATPLPPR